MAGLASIGCLVDWAAHITVTVTTTITISFSICSCYCHYLAAHSTKCEEPPVLTSLLVVARTHLPARAAPFDRWCVGGCAARLLAAREAGASVLSALCVAVLPAERRFRSLVLAWARVSEWGHCCALSSDEGKLGLLEGGAKRSLALDSPHTHTLSLTLSLTRSLSARVCLAWPPPLESMHSRPASNGCVVPCSRPRPNLALACVKQQAARSSGVWRLGQVPDTCQEEDRKGPQIQRRRAGRGGTAKDLETGRIGPVDLAHACACMAVGAGCAACEG